VEPIVGILKKADAGVRVGEMCRSHTPAAENLRGQPRCMAVEASAARTAIAPV